MALRPLLACANLYVLAYVLDAGLSVADELLKAFGLAWLGVPRSIVAQAVALVAFLVLPSLLVTPRLPGSVLLIYAGSALWFVLGAAPLGMLAGSHTVGVATAIQVLLALAGLLRIQRLNGGQGWLLRPESMAGPAWSWRHSLGWGAVTALLLPPVALGYLALMVPTFMVQMSQGFLGFDARGVWTAERRYVREDREVILIGMIHLGEGAAYRELLSDFEGEPALVLEEGVSDEQGLLETRLSYERAAWALGLEPQETLESYAEGSSLSPELDGPSLALPQVASGPERSSSLSFRNADVDVSDFRPQTLEWLEDVARLWDSSSVLEALRQLLQQMTQQADVVRGALLDILVLRNEHLLHELEASLSAHPRLIVPWGALHMPGLERELLTRGFETSAERRRRLIAWSTILEALRSRPSA